MPSQVGNFPVCIQAFDANTIAPQSGTKKFDLTVNPPPNIVTTSLPNGRVGANYNQAIQVSGGTAPLTFSLLSGALPLGLGLNSSTGVISGTPTAPVVSSFSIIVNDAYKIRDTQDYTVTVTSQLVITTNSPLSPGTQGNFESRTFTATGGTPPYTWSISAGNPPPGMTTINPTTGVLSGTPTQAGIFNFTVQVQDSSTASRQTATKNFSITMNSALTIVTSSLPAGTRTGAYSAPVQVTGGTPPYSWSIAAAAGGLPPARGLRALPLRNAMNADHYEALTCRNWGYIGPEEQALIRRSRLLIAGCVLGSVVAEVAVRIGFERLARITRVDNQQQMPGIQILNSSLQLNI